MALASAQIRFIARVARQKQKDPPGRAASLRKERVWLPAFADVLDQ